VNETRWKGTWWIPGAPGNARAGTLHYRDDGQLNLELIGGFSLLTMVPAAEGPRVAEEREPVFPVIHGICGAERFTLLHVVALRTSGGLFGEVTDQSLNALRGLRGIHLASTAESVFDSIEVQLEYLLGWTKRTTMKASATLFEGRWTGEQTAQSTPADDQEATYGGLTLTLRVPHSQFRYDVDPRGSQRTMSSREWAELEAASPEPQSLDGFEQIVKAMADLMTLSAHAPSGALKRILRFTGTPEPSARRPTGRSGNHGPPGPPAARLQYRRAGRVPVHAR
jgi:hypothetical protein